MESGEGGGVKRRAWTEAEDDQLRELAGTIPAEEIGKILNRPKGGVHHRIQRLGLKGHLHGEHHWFAKISRLQAAMIGTLRDHGFSAREIRAAFNLKIAKETIDDIGAGRTWN